MVSGPVERDGKRALFSPPTPPAVAPPGEPSGKAALYSSAVRRPRTVVLDCSHCHGRTRVGYVEFARRHLPVWLWLPWREHSRLIECPACGHRTWVAARWLR